MKVYGDRISGNCLKVKYTADFLGLDYEWVDVDILAGESRTEVFLARNPQGQVPAIELDNGECLAQSNAIIRYLAADSELLPQDAFSAAKVDEWLFWEQYSHEPYVAVCRFLMAYLGKRAEEREAWRVERGESALQFMDQTLERAPYLTSCFTIADIALLAYTRLAGEGGFDLQPYGNVRRWIADCEERLGINSADT